jgi:phage terminase small subunit
MLTNRKRAFIENYIITRNATESAKRAGYSPKTSYCSGQRLTKDVEVMAIIDERSKLMLEELKLTDENIVGKLWHLANNSVRDADKINALTQVAKIKGLMKEQATQHLAIFNNIDSELPLTQSPKAQ